MSADTITWSMIRRYVMRRDLGICQACGEPADEVDHIWPRYWGGPDEFDNLRAICGTCNKRKGSSVDWAAATDQQLAWAGYAIRERFAALSAELEQVVSVAARRPKPMSRLIWVAMAMRDTAAVHVERIRLSR